MRSAGSSDASKVDGVSQPLTEPEHLPPATEQQIRAHVGEDRDLFDMFEFQREATTMIGAEVVLYSHGGAAQRACQP
jgi:hypothetical protein